MQVKEVDYMGIIADHVANLKHSGGYISWIQFDMNADYPLAIVFTDAGGNRHNLEYNRRGYERTLEV